MTSVVSCDLAKPAGNKTCTSCGDTGAVLRFWEQGGFAWGATDPVHSLCIHCLTTHEESSALLLKLAECETMDDCSFDFDDGRMTITTDAGPLGSFTHVFNLERDVIDESQTDLFVEYTTGWTISFSEMYQDERLVTDESGWTDYAKRVLMSLQGD